MSDVPEHLVTALRSIGLEPRVHDTHLYLSIPDRSELTAGAASVPSRPAVFSRSTEGARVRGDALVVGEQAPGDVRGRVVIARGNPSPELVYPLEHGGAAAQIYAAGGDERRDCVATAVWGAPTHETLARRPRTPILCVDAAHGEALLRKASSATIPVSVATWLREGWFPVGVPVVELEGSEDPQELILVHGSADEPALLEVARALREAPRAARTVRIAFWPATGQARAAASSWYADAFAAEIDEWCVAHVNVEAAAAGADDTPRRVAWMAEAAELCLETIDAAATRPVSGTRPPRAGDYSFSQIGVTGLYGAGTGIPDVPSCVAAILRIANAPLHPFDYTATVLELGAAIQRYQAAAGQDLDLSGLSRELKELRQAIAAWRAAADAAMARNPPDRSLRKRLNATLRRLARLLVPLGYARGERFDHDPAVRFSAVPRLEAALHLSEAQPELKPLIRTALQRERNRISAAVRDARRLVS